MLDIRRIREQTAAVRDNLARRHDATVLAQFDELVQKDRERLALLKEVDDLKRQRNEITRSIAGAKQKGQQAEKELHRATEIGSAIGLKDDILTTLANEIEQLLFTTPNLLHDTVPLGTDDKDNREIRRIGKKPTFTFEPKSHLEILEESGLIDFVRGAKVAGHGFYYLKGDGVVLDAALQRFALDYLRKKGFTVVAPPLMLNDDTFKRVTDWETFDTQSYKIEGEPLRLIGTAEHPIGGMLRDEVLLKDELPVLFAGVSPCFRKEVGAHGKYTRGLFRVHQFNKVEQFVFCHPDESWAWHEKIQKYAEDLYAKLGLHVRVLDVCTGDIGTLAAKKYDIEVWMADDVFRESGSNSNCTDYQARRLGVRFREKEGTPPAGFVHTLNNTALATSRTMVALIEQHQRKDGTVKIPAALAKYTGFSTVRAPERI